MNYLTPFTANTKNWIRINFLRQPFYFVALLFWLWALPAPGQAPEVPHFNTDLEMTSESGYFKLVWAPGSEPADGGNAPEYLLQQSTDEAFTTPVVLYQGLDLATFVSGLENGDYYYRLKAVDPRSGEASNWSEPVRVTVRHHSLAFSLSLFGLGATVFLATLAIVVSGARATRTNQEP